jgi:hypothetical protein
MGYKRRAGRFPTSETQLFQTITLSEITCINSAKMGCLQS